MARLTRIGLALLMVAISLDATKQTKTDILMKEWYPGDILQSTEHSDIEHALREVAEDGSILETRTVALGIASMKGCLERPQWHLLDGRENIMMPAVILEGNTGLLLFTKSLIGIKGVYGVLTYDIADSEFRVAVMFNSPWNRVLYNNRYNFKVFAKTTPVDKHMVRHMYEIAGSWEDTAYQERTEYGVHLYGTMSSKTDARVIMWVDTSGLDIRLGPARHAECEYRFLKGDRCWRECTPTGWCWTNTKCKRDDDCDGYKLFCHLSCNKP